MRIRMRVNNVCVLGGKKAVTFKFKDFYRRNLNYTMRKYKTQWILYLINQSRPDVSILIYNSI